MNDSKAVVHSRLIQHLLLVVSLICIFSVFATKPVRDTQTEPPKTYPPYPHIEVSTNLGKFYLELDGIRAPLSTRNFLEYVEAGHYTNTLFHRVIPGFVAQGGGLDEQFVERDTREPVVNESGNGLSNRTGTIAMAREFYPHSATAQFYINLADNKKLDPKASRWGYAVFGEVLYGMPLIQAFSNKPTGAAGGLNEDVPREAVIVRSMRIMDVSEEIPIEPIVLEDWPEDNLSDTVEHSDQTKPVNE